MTQTKFEKKVNKSEEELGNINNEIDLIMQNGNDASQQLQQLTALEAKVKEYNDLNNEVQQIQQSISKYNKLVDTIESKKTEIQKFIEDHKSNINENVNKELEDMVNELQKVIGEIESFE